MFKEFFKGRTEIVGAHFSLVIAVPAAASVAESSPLAFPALFFFSLAFTKKLNHYRISGQREEREEAS